MLILDKNRNSNIETNIKAIVGTLIFVSKK